MTFEHDYKHLIVYAQELITQTKIGHQGVKAEDIVNSAYIEYFTTGKKYEKGAFKSLIKKSLFTEIEYTKTFIGVDDYKKIERPAHTDSYCSSCKEIKPIAGFYTRVRKATGYVHVRTKCKTCENKQTHVWQKKTKAWLRRDRTKINEYKRKWYAEKTGKKFVPKPVIGDRINPQCLTHVNDYISTLENIYIPALNKETPIETGV